MDNVVDILKKVGALITNSHIVLTSGRHTAAYINPDKILPHTQINSQLGKMFAEKYKNKNIEIVIGPAYGGIIFSQWVAYHLSKLRKKEILGIFTEKTADKNQMFERGFDELVKGKKVLIVEDVTATGSSVKKVIISVNKAGGKVMGVSVIVNRDPVKVNSKSIGAPFTALTVLNIDSYEEKNCPLCKKQIPINIKVGHGREYLEAKRLK
ncbi:MAG: phosphoribosyltransferase family protein [Patescibacteria group bacterium]